MASPTKTSHNFYAMATFYKAISTREASKCNARLKDERVCVCGGESVLPGAGGVKTIYNMYTIWVALEAKSERHSGHRKFFILRLTLEFENVAQGGVLHSRSPPFPPGGSGCVCSWHKTLSGARTPEGAVMGQRWKRVEIRSIPELWLLLPLNSCAS